MPTFEDGRLMFDLGASSGNVSSLVGKDAILVCVVRNIQNQSISWIRHSPTTLLSVNKFVYTTSDRIKVYHDSGTDEWRLIIRPLEITDASWYSCQVSITPHMEHRVYLHVIQPTTLILGPINRYIEEGSTINLTCIIEAGPLNLNPSFVYWNYDGKIITYDRERGGTVMISERGAKTTSSLIITHASKKDSGRYECDPQASYPQSVNVHVIKKGSPSDAVRRSSANLLQSTAVKYLALIWLTFFLINAQA